jgi:hypothetical protein
MVLLIENPILSYKIGAITTPTIFATIANKFPQTDNVIRSFDVGAISGINA